MPHARSTRRLIVNADDFGRSRSINEAVIRAHREGVLTSASLMVNGTAFDEAVEMARENPKLGIGLHLTLVCGSSALPHRAIPDLVNEEGEFSNNPVAAGVAYFARRQLQSQLRAEITAQFEKFQSTGLTLDHVNGHLNMHLHPTILGFLGEPARPGKFTAMRITRDPFWLNTRLASGRWFYRSSHALVFAILSRQARPRLRDWKIRHARRVFGLLQNGVVHEDFVVKLLRRLPPGDSELYSHPSLAESKDEFDALVSPKVRRMIEDEGIALIRYQDL